MLIGNYSVIHKSPGKYLGGSTVADNRANFNKSGLSRCIYCGDGNSSFDAKSGIPYGYVPPYSWVMPQDGGALASINEVEGSGSLTGAMAKGINIESSMTGVGSVSSNLSLIVQAVATLTGSGVLSGSMVGTVAMVATLAGTGDLAGALQILANCIATLTGTGSVTSDLKGTASLEADIFVNQSEATTQEIAAAVWNALASAFNESGTMGEKMNDAGAAGDPWGTALPGSYGAGTAGEIVGKKLLKKGTFIALK